MFHTSSYRHEQYIKRTKSTRSTGSSTLSPIKRCSIESEISRTDSGYASCTSNSNHKQDISLTDSNDSLFTSSMTESSTESRRASEESAILNALKQHEQQKEINKATTATATTATHHKKLKKGKSQIPRQPDLVYSCPRPLAFPFHNDDQFLPIAEADPRDVARVSPSSQHHPSRSQSLSSSSTSSVKQKILAYDRFGTFKSYHSTTTTSQKPLSFNDNNKGGTVRSLRSIFQLPDSSSFLSNSNSNNKNPISFNLQQQQQLEVQVDEPQHPYALKKLEIKKGTVQSIKDIFTNLSNKDNTGSYSTSPPHSVTSKGMPPRKQSNHRVGATIRQYDSKVTTTVFRPDNNNSSESQYTPPPPPPPLSSATLKKEKHFTRKAFEFASNIWKKKDVDATPQKKNKKSDSELPKTTTTNLITTEIKNFSVRILALPAAWLNSNTTEQKQDKDNNHNDEEKEGQEHEQDTTISKSDATTTTTTTTTTTVGKLWKSFKRLVVGKKTSRVGVL